jgi:hypothetical protein
MDLEKRLENIERRLSILENGHGLAGETTDKPIEMDLVLPEADINGLRFNATGVSAVFEKQDDGWYHSRDILFLSARNVEDNNSRDILTEYLNLPGDNGLREQLAYNLGVRQHDIEVSLPKENEGIKKYNGVDCWYWLHPRSSSSAAAFCYVTNHGFATSFLATGVGGCAPAFRVGKGIEKNERD